MGTNDPIRPVQAPKVRPVPAGDRGRIRRHDYEEPQEQPAPKKRRDEPEADKKPDKEGGIDAYV